jgi:muramoyltetrapeptide carboxypeptidase
MNRKNFINAVGTLTAGFALPIKGLAVKAKDQSIFKIPAYLKTGDTVGITSPAGYTNLEEMLPAIKVLESWGYKIKIGQAIGKKDFNFGGSDEDRRKDFQQMLDDTSIKAIMCARSGYGIVRIIDDLDWKIFKQKPKWIIGFSDVTVLHSHIHSHCQVASIHSKMTNSFPGDWFKAERIQVETINSINRAITGKKMVYGAIPNAQNKNGVGEGLLIGGNLKLLESMAGTTSDIDTDGKILFIEDTGEYLYSIDRMFWNLQRTGKLKNLKGLIIGGFGIKPDDEGEEFGRTLQDIVLEKLKNYNYPVCFDFSVGHQRANFALKCGVKHKLVVTQQEVTLTEII